jgi:hypothetical protein
MTMEQIFLRHVSKKIEWFEITIFYYESSSFKSRYEWGKWNSFA